jgi:hypothetical protein
MDLKKASNSSKQSSTSSTETNATHISVSSEEFEELLNSNLGFLRKYKSMNSKVESVEDAILKGGKSKVEKKLLHKIFEENYINVAHLLAVTSEGLLSL